LFKRARDGPHLAPAPRLRPHVQHLAFDPESRFISTWGLFSATGVHAEGPSLNSRNLRPELLRRMRRGASVYVCSANLVSFVDRMLPEITVPFVLVSGDADDEIPTDLERSGVDVERLLGDERLLHWFAQNCVLTHKKITRMPIGIDYHTLSNPPRIPHP
jgi:hypothetical protein